MKKKALRIFILLLYILFFTGCSQSVEYSEKFEGIPIYPGVELKTSTEYIESYEAEEFGGDFEDVKEFYTKQIDQEKWSVEENSLHDNENNDQIGFQGYILKDGKREVSLVLNQWKYKNSKGPLYIVINGSPLKEGKIKAEGQSKHWNTALEYVITKDRVLINGYATYIGDNPPKEVDNKFLKYEVVVNPPPKEGFTGGSSVEEAWGQGLEDSRIKISGQSSRSYELETLKEAIKNAYIEFKWEEQGEEKIEKVEIAVVP